MAIKKKATQEPIINQDLGHLDYLRANGANKKNQLIPEKNQGADKNKKL